MESPGAEALQSKWGARSRPAVAVHNPMRKNGLAPQPEGVPARGAGWTTQFCDRAANAAEKASARRTYLMLYLARGS